MNAQAFSRIERSAEIALDNLFSTYNDTPPEQQLYESIHEKHMDLLSFEDALGYENDPGELLNNLEKHARAALKSVLSGDIHEAAFDASFVVSIIDLCKSRAAAVLAQREMDDLKREAERDIAADRAMNRAEGRDYWGYV